MTMTNVVSLTAPSVHLQPPDGMPADQQKVWRLTVESRSADFFGQDAVPMLVEYCRAVVTCDLLAKQVENAITDGSVDAIKTLLDMRDKESRRVASLATKLRLTNQSRYTPQAAATAAKKGGGGKVWQFGKTGD
jgi:hypothetical protein